MTTTDETFVLTEPDEDGEGTRLVARLVDNGHQVWWADVGDDPYPVAQHDGALVVGSDRGTTSHDLTSGVELWSSPRTSGSECKGGTPRAVDGPDLQQPAVFLPSSGTDARVDVLRVSDGKVALREMECLNFGRLVDDVFVEHGRTLTGRSVATGRTLWEQEWPGDAEAFVLPDTGDTVHIPGDDDTYHSLDLRTGETTPTSPGDGWEVGPDQVRHQRAEVLWQPVVRGEELGLWEIGSDRVVPVPGTPSISIAEADGSGWVAVTGSTTDLVGEPQHTTWAVSPEGEVHGPFTGGNATQGGASTISAGVLQVGSRVYPLD